MKVQTALAALAALALASGCVVEPDPKDPDQHQTTVQGLFVSGHLGNYMDCPGDGYMPDDGNVSSDEPTSSGAAPREADLAPCPEGEECTYAPLNCEDAQATIQLTNDGELTIDKLQIQKIELLDADMQPVATLPLIGVSDVNEGGTFDGDIDPAEELDLRIDFQGPGRPYDLMDTDTGYIKLTISGDEHLDIIIESDELYVLPSVVT